VQPRTPPVLTRRFGISAAAHQAPLITTGGAAILAALGAYFGATPGAAAGFLDYFVLAPLSEAARPRQKLEDFTLLRKLGEGGFGDVYSARLERPAGGGPPQEVVLKRARGFGAEEAWMNGRAARACPRAVASFVTAFRDARQPQLPRSADAAAGEAADAVRGAFDAAADAVRGLRFDAPRLPWDKAAVGETAAAAAVAKAAKAKGAVAPPPLAAASGDDEVPLWLVWRLEGTRSLADVIADKDFPYSVEAELFGAPLPLPRGPERSAATLRELTRQVLEALAALHGTGIVHRDVKPENFILVPSDAAGAAARTWRLKAIDLGAAADLRCGINYAPREYLLDPRYAAPEQYIMSTQTPRAPPVPAALLLSPALWQLNLPDRFDVYAVGLMLLQMALPSLRADNALVAARRALAANGHDLDAWRETYERRPLSGSAEGWAILDASGGAGWDLIRKLARVPAGARLSAAAALRHPFVAGRASGGGALLGAADDAMASLQAQEGPLGRESGWVLRRLARSGTAKEGGFTEAQMERITDLARPPTVKEASRILDRALAQTEVGGEEGRGGGTGRVVARRPPPRRAEAKAPPPPPRPKGNLLGGVLQKVNFWGSFDEAGETRRGGEP